MPYNINYIALDLIDNKSLINVLPLKLNKNNLSDISTDKNQHFLQFNFANKVLPHQGFKIHISCTENNYQQILNEIYNFCIKNKLSFKYIANLKELLNNLSGKSSLWSSGKFITIYPSSLAEFKTTVINLYNIKKLRKAEGITVTTDRRFKDSSVIFYRYGIISGPDINIYNPKTNTVEYKDYTKKIYNLPAWISEPFPNNVDDAKHSKYLFKTVIPIKALNSKASGSTFLAKDSRNNEFILKDAKPGFSEDGISYIDFAKNERKNLKLLHNFEFVPNYLTSFMEDNDFFLCEQKKLGISVDAFRASGNKNFRENSDYESVVKLYKGVLVNLISNLLTLHDNNIFLGDISSSNILIDEKTQKVSFIDVTQSFNVTSANQHYSFRTEGFFDENTSKYPALIQDNHQLGYLIISMFCRANMFLFIDKTGKTTINFFKKYAKINKIPTVFVTTALSLIKNPNQDLSEVIYNIKVGNYDPYNYDEEVINLSMFKSKLQNSIELSKINKLHFKENRNVDLNENDDYVFGSKLCNMWLKKVDSDFLNSTIKAHILNELKRLLDLCSDTQKLKGIKLSNIFALLYFSIISADEKHKATIDNVLTNIYKYFGYITKNKEVFFRNTILDNHLSPYLSDGTAGMLYLLLKYREKFKSSSYDEEILLLVNTLRKNFMPQNASMANGICGILVSLIFYMQSFKDSSCVQFIKEHLMTLPYYSYQLNNLTLIINPSFKNLDIDFEKGNAGVIYVLNYAHKASII